MYYFIPDKIYNVLKWVCITVLPLIAWAYGAYAAEWGWPMVDQINNTIHITAAILGVLLGIDEFRARTISKAAADVE